MDAQGIIYYYDIKEIDDILHVDILYLTLDNTEIEMMVVNKEIITTKCTGNYDLCKNFNVFSFNEFKIHMKKYLNYKLKGSSTKNIKGLTLLYIESYIRWSVIINDLEKKGKILTKPSKSLMCLDPRQFWISSKNEDTAMDVDCLGLKLHEDINNEILELWATL